MSVGMSGHQTLTADGAVGPSGKRIRVFQATYIAGSGGAGELVLRNGAAASATAYVVKPGTAASKSDTILFGEKGLLFPDGCFFDKDANTDRVIVTYRVEA